MPGRVEADDQYHHIPASYLDHLEDPQVCLPGYRASGGRVGAAVGGTPVLLLVTTTRRSGEPRSVTLTYGMAHVLLAGDARAREGEHMANGSCRRP
jgi:F420H(2)-dependent quinone reductase